MKSGCSEYSESEVKYTPSESINSSDVPASIIGPTKSLANTSTL